MEMSSRRGIETCNSNEKSFLNLVKYHEIGDREELFVLSGNDKLQILNNNGCRNVEKTRGQKLNQF